MGKKENLDLLNKYFKFGSLKRLAAEPEEDVESDDQDVVDEISQAQEEEEAGKALPGEEDSGESKDDEEQKDLTEEGMEFGTDDGESGNDDEVETGGATPQQQVTISKGDGGDEDDET